MEAAPPSSVPKRRWPRYKICAPIRITPQGPGKLASVLGRGTELNQGGMTIFAAIDLMVGDQVAVELTPPLGDAPIPIRCFVRNRYCYTYGLEFITENDADYERVGQLASHLVRYDLGTPEGDPDAITAYEMEPFPPATLP